VLRSSGGSRVGAAGLGAIVLVLLAVQPAGSHSELGGARPGVGQEVGGTIDRIELEFRSPIEDAEIRVFEPDGTEITGPGHTEVDGAVATQEIETITETGQHQVTYTVLSVDGDLQDGAYVFTYDPEADPLPSEDVGGSTVLLWVFVVVSISVLAFGYTRLRRDPKRAGPNSVDPDAAGDESDE
jgi:methionine-rich copper-binding protein CopC